MSPATAQVSWSISGSAELAYKMDFLSYGDLFLLRANEANEYLTSFGFTESSCLVQEVEAVEDANTRPLVFQVLPRLSYGNAAALRHVTQSKTGEASRAVGDELTEYEKINNLVQSVAAEDKANERVIQLRMGEPVRYGQEIQLRHVASQYFLQCSGHPATWDLSSQQCELTLSGGAGYYLTMESKYKFRQPGDKVIYGDEMILRSSKWGLYLHVSEQALEAITGSAPTRGQGLDFAPHPSELTRTYEVNFADQKTVWQAVRFAKCPFDPLFLRRGDVVRLEHVAGTIEGEDLEVYIGQRDPKDGITAAGLFILEENDGKRRLRHLASGRLLAVEGGKIALSPHKHENKPELESSLVFYSTSGRLLTNLQSAALVKIACQGNFLSADVEQTPHRAEKRPQTAVFQPLTPSKVERISILAISNERDDVFTIIRADSEEVFEAECIKSSRNALHRYAEQMAKGQKPDHSQHCAIEDILKQLIFFMIKADSEDAWTCEGPAYPRRQQLFRTLGAIDVIVKALAAMFDGCYDLETLGKEDDVVRVCGLMYRLLTHASADSRASERYCAQWVPLFLGHLNRSTESTPILVESALTEIFSDNAALLEEVVTPTVIELLVSLLRSRQRDAKYLELLTALCIAQGKPIPRNQHVLSQALLSTPEVLIKLRNNKGRIQVNIHEYENWIELSELETTSNSRDSGRLYRYFLSLGKLTAALTAGRLVPEIQAMFPVDLCLNCAEETSLDEEIRSTFVRGLLCLHVDQGELRPMMLPNPIRVLSTLQSDHIFPSYTGILPHFLDQLKRFVLRHLRVLQGALPRTNESANRLTLSVLHLVEFLLTHGLYSSHTEVQALLPSLCSLLDGTMEAGSRALTQSQTMLFSDALKERESLQRSRFTLGAGTEDVVRCRLLTCEVLQTVLKIRTDMKLSLFLLNLKTTKSRETQRFEEPKKNKVLPEQTQSSLSSPQSTRTFETSDGIMWLEKALQDPVLDLKSSAAKDFLTVSLDLLQYRDPNLRYSVLSLLISTHIQSQQLLSALLSSQLLETESSIKALQQLKSKLPVLQSLCQSYTQWLGPLSRGQTSAEEVSEEAGYKQVCEVLFDLSTLGNPSLEGVYHMALGAEDCLQVEPKMLLEGVNTDVQQLLRVTGVHKLAISLSEQCDLRSNSQRTLSVRRFAYIFLARFCKGCSENQELLSPFAEQFVKNVPSTVFALQLVKEIYRDHYGLCRQVPIQLLRSLCKAINEIPLSPKKCESVRLLGHFLKAEGQIMLINQTKVLGQLLSFEGAVFSDLLSRPDSIGQLASQYGTGALPLPLQYLIDILDILALCCSGLNSKAESAVQSILPVTMLKTLLQAAAHCWPLKRAILRVLIDTHLDTELSLNISDGDVWNLLTILSQDLETIEGQITSKQSLLDSVVEVKSITLKYVYEAVFPTLTQFITRQKGKIPPEWSQFQLQHMLTQANVFLSHASGHEQPAAAISFMQAASDLLQINLSVDKPSSLQSQLTIRKTAPVSELSNLLQKAILTDEIRHIVDMEFDKLATCCVNVEKLSAQMFGARFAIQSKEIFSAIITVLGSGNEKEESCACVQEHGLRLLRRSIEVEVATPGPAADWSSEDWLGQATVVAERQQLLSDLGTVELLCGLYQRSSQMGVKVQAVLLGITMLLGGNRVVQQRMLKCLQEDKMNLVIGEMKRELSSLFAQVKAVNLRKLRVMEGDYEEEEDVFEELPSLQRVYKVDASHHSVQQRLIDLLRFVQLFCEGHYRDMQNHLRAQMVLGEVHSQSFNFVQAGSEFLSQYLKFLQISVLPIGLQLLDTLVEMVQGPCRENQRLLSQPKSLENCRDILQALRDPKDVKLRGFADTSHPGISALKFKAASLLLSLLEGGADAEIIKHIAESLDFEACKMRILEVFKLFLKELNLGMKSAANLDWKLKKDSFKGDVCEGFNLYCLLSKLADDFPPARSQVMNFSSSEQRTAFQFFASHTARIEVVAEGQLQRVYFPIQPLCQYVSENSKDAVMLAVNRTSPATKVTDLLQMSTDLIAEMDHNYWLVSKKISINSDGLRFLRLLELVVVLMINGFMLFGYNYTVEVEHLRPDWSNSATKVLGIVIIVTATLSLLLWLLLRARLVLQHGRRELKLKTTGVLTSAKLVAKNQTFIYLSVYLGMVLLSQWYEIFFAVLLLDVVFLFPTLNNVARALTLNAKQLLWTFALLMVWNYFYGFWGFHQNPAMYYDSSIGTFGESLCQSLWECVLTHFNNVSSK